MRTGMLLMLFPLACTGRAAADTRFRGEADAFAQTGYDSDILADPSGSGVLEPLATGLYGVGAELKASRAGAVGCGGSDRLEGALIMALTRYGETSLSSDRDLRAWLRWGTTVGRALVDVQARFTRFRRPDLPIYDLDQPQLDCSAALGLSRSWTGIVRLGYARPSYPGRVLGDLLGTENASPQSVDESRQVDDRIEATAGVVGARGSGSCAVGLAWRDVDSNDPIAKHAGPGIELRFEWARRRAVPVRPELRARSFGLSLSWSERRYPGYPVLAAVGSEMIDTGESRRDRSWQAALFTEHALSARVRVFADAVLLHQSSNVAALEFDQARLAGGIRVRLIGGRETPAFAGVTRRAETAGETTSNAPAPGATGGLSSGERSSPSDELSPRRTVRGVLFRVRAVGAISVSVVGGFNAWQAEGAELRDENGDGLWEGVLPVPDGIWRYAFLVDGRWIRPDGAPRYEDDGFGTENGILDPAWLEFDEGR